MGANCEDDCKNELIALIKEWPEGAKPDQLQHKTRGKLGTYLAKLNSPIANQNYDLLVHVHNHDSIGAEIDPGKKWGKTLNMGGIPGIGIGARFTRGVGSVASGLGHGVLGAASLAHSVYCFGRYGCGGRRKTRKARGKKARGTRRR